MLIITKCYRTWSQRTCGVCMQARSIRLRRLLKYSTLMCHSKLLECSGVQPGRLLRWRTRWSLFRYNIKGAKLITGPTQLECYITIPYSTMQVRSQFEKKMYWSDHKRAWDIEGFHNGNHSSESALGRTSITERLILELTYNLWDGHQHN